MIIGLGHQAQTGKDTIAKHLVEEHGFVRFAFADKLKDIALDIDPLINEDRLSHLVKSFGWELAKQDVEVRRFLQRLGTACRDHLHSAIWVNSVMRQIELLDASIPIVITDVRYHTEFDIIRNEPDSKLVKVVRRHRGIVQQPNHKSETELADADWDATFVNDGTIDEMKSQWDEMIRVWAAESTD